MLNRYARVPYIGVICGTVAYLSGMLHTCLLWIDRTVLVRSLAVRS
jgi:hypothetical protein